jgi:hypothetical protein
VSCRIDEVPMVLGVSITSWRGLTCRIGSRIVHDDGPHPLAREASRKAVASRTMRWALQRPHGEGDDCSKSTTTDSGKIESRGAMHD